MPTFNFGKSKSIKLGPSKTLEEAKVAVAEQLELVEAGRTTARTSMKYLLREFPVLRKERRGSVTHPLSPLIPHFWSEHRALGSR